MINLKMCKSFLRSRDFVTQNKKELGFVKPQIINFVTENTTLKPRGAQEPRVARSCARGKPRNSFNFCARKDSLPRSIIFSQQLKTSKKVEGRLRCKPFILFLSFMLLLFYRNYMSTKDHSLRDNVRLTTICA